MFDILWITFTGIFLFLLGGGIIWHFTKDTQTPSALLPTRILEILEPSLKELYLNSLTLNVSSNTQHTNLQLRRELQRAIFDLQIRIHAKRLHKEELQKLNVFVRKIETSDEARETLISDLHRFRLSLKTKTKTKTKSKI